MATTYYDTYNGRIFSETTNGVQLDYLHDALGSVVATVDQTSTVVNTYRYKPYGDLLAKTGAAADPKFLWVGGWGYRNTTNVWAEKYVRARHYGVRQTQWTTVDELWPAEPSTMYVGGSPSNQIDPTGTQYLECGGNCFTCAEALLLEATPTGDHACHHNYVHCFACCILTRSYSSDCAAKAQVLQVLTIGSWPTQWGYNNTRLASCQSGIDGALSHPGRDCNAICFAKHGKPTRNEGCIRKGFRTPKPLHKPEICR